MLGRAMLPGQALHPRLRRSCTCDQGRARAAPLAAARRDPGAGGPQPPATPPGKAPAEGPKAAAGRGQGQGQGEPLVLTSPSESKPSAPLKRSSFRQRRKSSEQRQREREEQEAEWAALRAARPRRPGPSGPAAGLRVALVDGYNAIHASPELKGVAGLGQLEDARTALNRLASAAGEATDTMYYVVYDAMYGPSARRRGYDEDDPQSKQRIGPRCVAVFSAGSEADTYIGRAVAGLRKAGADSIMVVSNDRRVQDLAFDDEMVSYARDVTAWLQEAEEASRRPRNVPLPPFASPGRPAPRGPGSSGDRPGPTQAQAQAHKVQSSRSLARQLEALASSGSESDWEEGPGVGSGGWEGLDYEADDWEEEPEEGGQSAEAGAGREGQRSSARPTAAAASAGPPEAAASSNGGSQGGAREEAQPGPAKAQAPAPPSQPSPAPAPPPPAAAPAAPAAPPAPRPVSALFGRGARARIGSLLGEASGGGRAPG
ncbi:hypothetical protein HYH03_013554 [Edaphochlamys debaryana]|uniref:NYN domain-containing protein n=1 Tax=Edaphochlamys debaryana TaxID=47281 RepID=A0A835XQS0_9CHLO|nr:hypothetical protein HYH03_013554 [Edaphochlamys debaryana]|eukprot:KAG2487837.1 hypothetical protein HYH03_013554 [Edaphochlamys debaryana]